MKKFGLYINGQYTHVEQYLVQEKIDPMGEPYKAGFSQITTPLDEASQESLEAAILGLQQTHEQILGQGFFPLAERLDFLSRLAKRVENSAENLARTLCAEVSKPITLARGEVARAVSTIHESIRVCAEYGKAKTLECEDAELRSEYFQIPAGPVLAITPFNFPLNLIVHKVAPAIAIGAPVLLKPSDKALLTAMSFVDLCQAEKLPEGMLNYINCDNATTASLVTDPRFAMVSFTGSSSVGWQLAQKAPKRVALELGGNAPVFLDQGIDFNAAIKKLLPGAFGFAGQSCISVQNVYVHQKAWDEFCELLPAQVEKFPFGDPSSEEVLCSRPIDKQAWQRIHKEQEKIKDHLMCKSEFFIGKDPSKYISPCVYKQLEAGHCFMNQEQFAPFFTISPIENFDAFRRQVNNQEHRLQCGVFSNDEKTLEQAAQRLDFGGVCLNQSPTFRLDAQPYGGQGLAGLGREGPRFAVDEYSTFRSITRQD